MSARTNLTPPHTAPCHTTPRRTATPDTAPCHTTPWFTATSHTARRCAYPSRFAGLALLALAAAQAAQAHDFKIDQSNTGEQNLIGIHIQGLPPIGQEFTPQQKSLDVVELWTFDGIKGNAKGGTLYVNIREKTIDGKLLGTSQEVALKDSFNGVVHFDFDKSVALTPNSVYVIDLIAKAGSDGWYVESTPNEYKGGRAIMSGNPSEYDDLWFKEGPVPEPASLLLMTLGAVTVIRRRHA